MAKIKSALELALERTADIQIDKRDFVKKDVQKRGRIVAGNQLKSPKEGKLKEELGSHKGEELTWFKEGVLETLLANLTLPRAEDDLQILTPLEESLSFLWEGRSPIQGLFKQIRPLLSQYLENIDHLKESLKAQYEPQLRYKEKQIQEQTGQAITLSLEDDQEFLALLSEQLQRIEEQYVEVLKEAKDQIRQAL